LPLQLPFPRYFWYTLFRPESHCQGHRTWFSPPFPMVACKTYELDGVFSLGLWAPYMSLLTIIPSPPVATFPLQSRSLLFPPRKEWRTPGPSSLTFQNLLVDSSSALGPLLNAFFLRVILRQNFSFSKPFHCIEQHWMSPSPSPPSPSLLL